MKALLIAAMIAISFPAFAADTTPFAATDAAQEALNEGLIPADQLDSAEYQTPVETLQRRPPGRRPGRPFPRPPRQERWQCVARDRIQRSYRGDGRNVNEARREAMRDCQRASIVGRCRLVGCGRR